MQMEIYILTISYNIIYLSFERKYTLFNKVENKNGDRNVGCKYNYIILISVFRPTEVSSSKTVKSKKDNISVFSIIKLRSLTLDCEGGRTFSGE